MTEELRADLLVIGGGMAGLSAAATAAGAGAQVIVIERAPEVGGSAVLSGGNLQTAPTVEGFRTVEPNGDPALAALVVGSFGEAVEWMRSLGVTLGPEAVWLTTYPFMRGYRMDILGYIRRCAAIAASSGSVVTDTTVRSLIRDRRGRVGGARVTTASGDVEVVAPATVVATGGFAANPALRAKYINRNARGILLRAHPYNRGDGIRLGLRAGAATSPFMDGFYGHLICAPLARFAPSDYGRLSQYQSMFGILVNVFGERFTDESAGDVFSNQALLRQPGRRAVYVVDERLRRSYMSTSHMVGTAWIDRFAEAAAAGAHSVRADSLAGLAAHLKRWGFDHEAFLRTVASYNAGVLLPHEPPRRLQREPLGEPPFHAVEVQPSITFTNGGLRIDDRARVVGGDGAPIPGLLAAGSDAGGVYQKSYVGGLAAALVLGRRAAATALADRPS